MAAGGFRDWNQPQIVAAEPAYEKARIPLGDTGFQTLD